MGGVGAAALGRVLASQLYGVRASDVTTYVIVAVVLGAVALVAAAAPGLRVTRIDPAKVLREG